MKLFDLPENWSWMDVSKIASDEKYSCVGGPFGSKLSRKHYVDEPGVPVIRGQNLGDDTQSFIMSDFVWVSEKKADSLVSNLAYPGDIVFTQRGTLGQVGMIPEDSDFKRFVVSQSQMKLTVNKSLAIPQFVFSYFRSAFARQLIENSAIVTGVPHINLGILRQFPIPVPPLSEQRRIAHVLGTLDDKIELNRQMNATLEAIAQTIFKSWFVDFDGHDDLVESDELGLIPRGWEVRTIKDVVKSVGGATPRTKNPEYWDGGEVYWTTPKDLSSAEAPVLLDTARKITEAGLDKISSGLLPVGTLLMSSRAPVGYLALTGIPTAINQGYIAMLPGGKLSPLYLLHWAHFNMDVIKSRAGGTTFAEISKRNFRPIPIAVPPKSLLEKFETTVSPMFEKITANLEQSRTLTELRDTLLPKLISGELRVPEALELADEAVEESEEKAKQLTLGL